ncbi:hypothetical protein ABVK25_008431 [Lepraria finkii]|uniref:Uncharacterized protein n=1 Tax=Lepraria finkii TaxID=1340010 RepID=A0ABR4B3D9_9LECA
MQAAGTAAIDVPPSHFLLFICSGLFCFPISCDIALYLILFRLPVKMLYSPLLLSLLTLSSYVQAQSSSSVYVEPMVPTGTPIPGDYSGALRPQVHFSPPIDFMVCECGCAQKPAIA